jgi:hypothetical protein
VKNGLPHMLGKMQEKYWLALLTLKGLFLSDDFMIILQKLRTRWSFDSKGDTCSTKKAVHDPR